MIAGYTIPQLEDALLARIKGALPQLKTVETFGGDSLEELRQIAFRFPAVYAVLREHKPAAELQEFGGFGGVYGSRVTFDLLVCCRNLRGEEAGRRDSGGAYEVLEGLRAALVGQTLGLTILPVEFDGEEAALIEKDMVVFKATYVLSHEWQFEED